MNARTLTLLGTTLLATGAWAAAPNPAPSATPGNAVSQLYQQRCAKCHGADGAGHGKLSDLLDPKPCNFTDVKWQSERSDAQIVDAITNGHESKRRISKKMPYFGTRYSQVEIEALVTVVRAFKKP